MTRGHVDGLTSPHPIIEQMPSIYQEDHFAGMFTAGFDDVLSPVFDAPDGVQAGFNGDYSGLTISRGVEAHPIWSDTRNADPFSPANGVVHDEDIFTASHNLPNGKARTGPGRIGRH